MLHFLHWSYFSLLISPFLMSSPSHQAKTNSLMAPIEMVAITLFSCGSPPHPTHWKELLYGFLNPWGRFKHKLSPLHFGMDKVYCSPGLFLLLCFSQSSSPPPPSPPLSSSGTHSSLSQGCGRVTFSVTMGEVWSLADLASKLGLPSSQHYDLESIT